MNFKTPDPKMAAFIVLGLLALFAYAFVIPTLNVPWIKENPEFNEGLMQTLQMLLVLGIGYYIGTSKGSEEKNAIIAQQAQTAATVAGSPTPLGSGNPTGTLDDPVAVTPVPPQP